MNEYVNHDYPAAITNRSFGIDQKQKEFQVREEQKQEKYKQYHQHTCPKEYYIKSSIVCSHKKKNIYIPFCAL